jgi:S1-C subfamily serine protease
MGVLFRLFLFFALVGCSQGSSCIQSNVSSRDLIQHVSIFSPSVREKSREAAVEIVSFNSSGDQIFGSGAYIVHNQQHYILTAAHVVSASPVAMITNKDETIIGDVIFLDLESDVALVSIEGMFTRSPISWSVSKNNKIGKDVFYSGYPNSYILLTIQGKIAGYDGDMTVMHSYVWKGASGSVVLDSKKAIVGVVSAVDVGSDVIGVPTIIEDVGLVAPVHTIDEFLNNNH